ncbi:hypothetical protein KUA25_29565, partial [Bacteroidales bacterium MSK.15.36]|nr:hypothetical protein [Bacteroidales bacterium MSK.15.36]
ESAGIAVNKNGFIDYFKDSGLVHEVFPKETLSRFRGNIGIGHVESKDNGEEEISLSVQPLVVGYKKGALALANDGNLINSKQLREKLEDDGVIFSTNTDIEVIANLIARFHKDDIEIAIRKSLKMVKGSYSLVLMTLDRLI